MGWIVAALLLVLGGAYFLWYAPAQESSVAVDQQNNQQASGTSEQTSGNPAFVGTWKSNSDAKFTREIRADGVIVDRYEGEPTAGLNGEWTAVNPAEESLLASQAAWLSGKSVLKVVWEGGVETTYFVVSDVSSTSLTTTDLSGRGAVTIYSKI